MLGPDVLMLLKSIDSVVKEERQILLSKSLTAVYLQRSPGTVGLKCLSVSQHQLKSMLIVLRDWPVEFYTYAQRLFSVSEYYFHVL